MENYIINGNEASRRPRVAKAHEYHFGDVLATIDHAGASVGAPPSVNQGKDLTIALSLYCRFTVVRNNLAMYYQV